MRLCLRQGLMIWEVFNSSPPSAAYMRQSIWSALVQIMAFRLFGTKPLFWTNVGLVSTGPLGTNLSEFVIKIQNFSFMKMHLKISPAKWRPFCPGGEELTALSELPVHYSDVIMSVMVSQIISVSIFTQPFVQARIKENIKAPRHWPLWEESIGDQ